jgi:formylglycine-generating enzyme
MRIPVTAAVRLRWLLRWLVLLCFPVGAPATAITIDWVTIGAPGNPSDWTGSGAVARIYRISATPVTNAQYVDFLNTKAASDPLELYNTNMASREEGGITRSGDPGGFTYQVKAGFANKPVNFVSFFDAVRFTNWLHNGRGSGDTETGAYTVLGDTATPSNASTFTRNPDATIFLPSDDEWYKAAYYDALSASYFLYPAGSHAQTSCAAPGPTPNTANCGSVVGTVTDVATYTGSASPYGTFDQGGNVWEWTDTSIGSMRGQRGGSFTNDPITLAASLQAVEDPTSESFNEGFRVASLPEPHPHSLLVIGIAGVALWRWRRAKATGCPSAAPKS